MPRESFAREPGHEAPSAACPDSAGRVEALLAGTTVEELDQAVAALAEAEAGRAEAQLAVERLTLRAPRDGMVEGIPFQPGDHPPPGATSIVMLADLYAAALRFHKRLD